jgi:hypothetical protein
MRVSALGSAARVTIALAGLLAVVPGTRAQDVRVTAPAPSAPAAEAMKPLTPEESAALGRALMFDPTDLAAGAPAKPLRMPSLNKPAGLNVSRSDRPDGSSTVAVKRPLPTDLPMTVNADVGADVNLAAPPETVYQPGKPLPGTAVGDPGSSVAWASVGMPNLASGEARVDPTNDQGTLAGTLKRSVPIGKDLSVALQDSYSVTQTLSASTASASGIPMAAPPAPGAAETQVWGNAKLVTFDLKPTGTTFGAGVTTASKDTVMHNTLSADQKLIGPLHVTTAVTDLGEPSENKSITAGFKLNW